MPANPLVALVVARLLPQLAALLAAQPELASAPLAPGSLDFPLDFALRQGFLPEAQLLAAAGGRAGEAPLASAAWSGDLPTMAWVAASGLDPVPSAAAGGAALARKGGSDASRRDAVGFLLDLGLVPDAWLVYQACHASPAALALLVERGLVPRPLLGAPIQEGGLTLQAAVDLLGLPHPYTVGVLPSGENALYPPIRAGNASALAAAIAAALGPGGAGLGAAVDPRVGPPLHFALAQGAAGAAAALLDAGASAAFVTPAGESAVGAAARGGDPASLSLALAAAPPARPGASTPCRTAGASPPSPPRSRRAPPPPRSGPSSGPGPTRPTRAASGSRPPSGPSTPSPTRTRPPPRATAGPRPARRSPRWSRTPSAPGRSPTPPAPRRGGPCAPWRRPTGSPSRAQRTLCFFNWSLLCVPIP